MTFNQLPSPSVTPTARRRSFAAAALVCLATAASAQMPGPALPALSRATVLADLQASQVRDRWDEANDRWVPRDARPATDSGLTRDTVQAELAATRLSSRWDAQQGAWLLRVPALRAADAPSRADVNASTASFFRTHDLDAGSQQWLLQGDDGQATWGPREP